MSSESIEVEAQVHLLAIRKALANRNAAVMVGAGFSRNAQGGENLATWRQLSEALAIELEPGHKPGDFTPAATSQLAEQYARVFSPTHLEQLIKRCVPDDQVSPGSLHTKLLELPWSEVFTTNYDTLLERAAERMFDVSYFTVCAREDIPQSKILGRRRIVKLHGSFPSHRPFILTEEEYRTYPERFAPFVNLVRQSLLENVFCLIGFSGDDPNFLHWLGWVRDMLDKHALPVYLFLAKEPTLGERKLYEARGVVPVVLPLPKSAANTDFHARYQELFNELAKPLAGSPLDWGDCPPFRDLPYDKQDDEAFSDFMGQLSVLSTYRETYPGWIVAPREIRQRFRPVARWLEGILQRKWVQERLKQHPAIVLLSVVDLYCWTQQVILSPIFDEIAALGRQALARSENETSPVLPSQSIQFLVSMNTPDAEAQRSTRIRVAMSLLTWARQSHRTVEYQEFRSLLGPAERGNSEVHDHLVYQEILRCLQRADRPMALQHVLSWRPKDSNAYAHVLRGSLMAEVSDVSKALPILEHAIQTLRRQQRSRLSDPALISQEAWACVVASHMKDAEKFFLRMRKTSSQPDGNSDEQMQEQEDFDDRLNALIARGYSAREELSTFASKLNAEAQPPVVETVRRTAGFDLGTSSTHRQYGVPIDLREKISASFAWLELLERVGLPTRTENALFYTDQMLQAAWWAKFADTPERSIGLFLRANQRDALKPRNRSDPPHRTGWLERQEVAKLTPEMAVELSSELMQQLPLEFEGTRPASRSSNRGEFLLEAFSRLAIRVQDSRLLMNWAEQLLNLHRTIAFQAEPTLWEAASQALGRIMDALPNGEQDSLLLKIFQLPLIPVRVDDSPFQIHMLNRWINLNTICRHCSTLVFRSVTDEWHVITEDLIHQLRASSETKPAQQIWARLEAMRQLNLLTEIERREVGSVLWRDVVPGKWPSIPGYYPVGMLDWPAPNRNAASQLLDGFLAQPLLPFSRGAMQLTLTPKGRSYCLGGEYETVGQILFCMTKKTLSLPEISKLIRRISEWLDVQQQHLVEDLNEGELYDSVATIVTYIDKMLGQCLRELIRRKRTRRIDDYIHRIAVLDDRFRVFPFVRINVQLELIREGVRDLSMLDDNVRSLVFELTSNNEQTSYRVFKAAFILLEDNHRNIQAVGRMMFDAIVSCVFTQRMPCLPHALNLLANLSRATWRRYLDDRTLLLLDGALTDLASALAYERPLSAGTIPDESIPLIRFNTMQLAHTLVQTAEAKSEMARRWLERAKDDPLPEIRLGRYKISRA